MFGMTHGYASWAGAIKLSLPAKAWVDCATTAPPQNTLLPDVNPVRVSFTELQTYLPLVLRLFTISPEGFLASL
eukprot:s228_g7.t1